MAIKLNPAKAKFVLDLLASNGNRFTPDELVASAGNERRARSALSHARMSGVTLEAIRDAGRAVTAYVFNGASLPAIAAATPKASKGSAKAKVVAEPKPVKAKTTKASSESSVRAINAAHAAKVAKTVKTPKVKAVDVSRISDEAKAAIKAKNLDTLKAVSAKGKGRLHPVTKRPLTDEQASVLDEFAEMEKQAELEELRAEEQAALRANAPSFLFKESYSE
jgi:hypothetical protein